MHDPHATCWGVPTSWYCTHLLSALDGLLHTKIVYGDRGWASNALQCQKQNKYIGTFDGIWDFYTCRTNAFHSRLGQPAQLTTTSTQPANHTLQHGIHKMSHGKLIRLQNSHSHFRFRFVPLNTQVRRAWSSPASTSTSPVGQPDGVCHPRSDDSPLSYICTVV